MKMLKLLVGVLALALTGRAPAQEPDGKGFSAKGSVPVHRVKLNEGTLYLIEAQGNGFSPRVISPGIILPYVQRSFNDDQTNFQTNLVPSQTKEYAFAVELGFLPFGRKPPETLDYTLRVTPISLAEQPLLSKQDELTAKDPEYKERKSRYKAYPIKLEEGRYYVIEMRRKTDRQDMDPYLILEDANGKRVASDDDGAGNLNARLIVQPKQAGEYRVIATTLGQDYGPFNLTVRGQAGKSK